MSWRLAQLYTVAAGTCDLVAGLLLVVAPARALTLMGVHPLPVEPVYMRWIGVFVFSIGLAYWMPFSGAASTRKEQLRAAWMMTAMVRLSIGAFTAVSIAVGALSSSFWSVPVTDLLLAIIQIVLLNRLPAQPLEVPAT